MVNALGQLYQSGGPVCAMCAGILAGIARSPAGDATLWYLHFGDAFFRDLGHRNGHRNCRHATRDSRRWSDKAEEARKACYRCLADLVTLPSVMQIFRSLTQFLLKDGVFHLQL